MADPLVSLTRWKAQETAIEVGAPMGALAVVWTVAYRLAVLPSAGRAATAWELAAMATALGAVTGWAISRQLQLFGRRRPWTQIGFGLFIGLALLLSVGAMTRSGFSSRCADTLKGELVVLPGSGESACRVGGIVGNPYLPGTTILPNWSGTLPPPLWGVFFGSLVLGALALRDRRFVPTRVVHSLHDNLRLAGAAGIKSVIGGLGKNNKLQACGNPTLWGEPCGQLYSGDKVFTPGEWCVRCRQVYTPNERTLNFTVVTLFTGDIDVLNSIERLDTQSWNPASVKPADARISGQERWVTLGTVSFPDVISVAQALSILHDLLPGFEAKDTRTQDAIKIAQERASRLCCWFWFGRFAQRLTYARPSSRARFAFGAQRLRDVLRDAGADIVLQLDIGLLPVELRVGFRQTFRDPSKKAETQNSKIDIWVPVAPSGKAAADGLWVDRIEGDALRAWLSTERRRGAEVLGVSSPRGYVPSSLLERQRIEAEEAQPSGGTARAEDNAPLDYVRVPYLIEKVSSDKDDRTREMEPAPPEADLDLSKPVEIALVWSPGDSIAEWSWLDWRQVELLRQQCLALVPYRGEP
jgi:hypothetical protein